MIRLLYWLIKRRWAICRECKWTRDMLICQKYTSKELDFVKGAERIACLGSCETHNKNGCCWGFKLKTGHIEPSEPWPRE
jgi:hypothetical protein